MTSAEQRSTEPSFDPIARRMRDEGLPELCVRTFRYYYDQLVLGETGMMPEDSIRPLADVPDMEKLPDHAAAGTEALPHAVMIRLNGGLGTSMGLSSAKSLLTAKEGLTFLEFIVRQVLGLRKTTGIGLPLVFMNSFSTEEDTAAELARFPELAEGQSGLETSFLQHKVPKIREADLEFVEWTSDPSLEWCPPGHGEIYTALVTSGLLERLLEKGIKYAFVSNADNLSAVLDVNILGYFADRDLPFMMEVADRTEADRKGGHVARRGDGRLILRESAQCPEEEMHFFQDVSKHRYFNTNNLWINLVALKDALEKQDYILGLPLIRNCKTVDPRDPDSPAVYQLETAMGAAISVFPRAQVLRVPRSRFAPVKTTNDLIALRSDACVVKEDMGVVPNPERSYGALVVELDDRFYRLLDDFDARFPSGPPSLCHCESITVKGDVRFGQDVVLKGRIELANDGAEQIVIPDGEVIEGS